jgi:hypothetical protein
MIVTSTHSILGWVGNILRTEDRQLYHYDRGNDVTVVVTRKVEFSPLYDRNATFEKKKDLGVNIDKII